jgi:alkylation response protein AidB-like acyl-CoA dehydrogenase
MTDEEAEAFRQRCRAFLDEHANGIDIDGPDPRGEKSLAGARVFQQALVDAGLAGLTYPTEYGGQGLTQAHERIWREEYASRPNMTVQLTISHGMALPMLAEYGTHEQKAQFLAKNISAEELWCQMFSEPGAGSDVASLQSRAVLDGDEWLLNGQKVWTTLAHACEYGIVIARTDPEQTKHRGITMFIVDMHAPGIEIRPINQIDGGMHFNEIFFTDVRIPKDWQVGDLNDGWRLATSMLMYERVAIGAGATSGVTHTTADWLIKTAQKNGLIDDPVMRQELMKLYCHESAKSLVSMRTRAEMKAGKTPGPGGSLGKLHGALISRMARSLAMEVVGPAAAAWEEEDEAARQYQRTVLSSFQASIAGGTDEIQKNIIGDRVLGLPREPSADKDVPFKDLLVGSASRSD